MTATMSAVKSRRFKIIALVAALVLLFNMSAAAVIQEMPKAEDTTAAPTTQPPATTVPVTEAVTENTQEDGSAVADEGSSEEGSTQEETTIDTEKYNELQEQYEQLEKEKAENEKKLAQVKGDIANQQQVVDGIYGKIDDTQNQIDVLGTKVDLLNCDINYTENQIEIVNTQLGSLSEKISSTKTAISEKEEVLAQTYELLKMRIRAMYMAGSGSNLEFLLTSEDFSTLLTRTELLVRVAEHDNNLMASIQADITELETLETQLSTSVSEQESKAALLDKQNETLQAKKSDAQSASAELENKKAEIQVQYAQAQDELNSLDEQSEEYQALIHEQEEQILLLSNEMEEFIKNNGSSSTDVEEETSTEETTDGEGTTEPEAPEDVQKPANPAKGMIFPIKHEGRYISSAYGSRINPISGKQEMHTGIDITAGGINNAPIYAAQAGEVIYASTKGGYGNYIVVDHGQGISTCYAHCNSIGVTVGQQVKQGQVIGKVGSTGYSTGPHLHFEVRIDGTPTNPMNYVSL